jgi:hypothetical protein
MDAFRTLNPTNCSHRLHGGFDVAANTNHLDETSEQAQDDPEVTIASRS